MQEKGCKKAERELLASRIRHQAAKITRHGKASKQKGVHMQAARLLSTCNQYICAEWTNKKEETEENNRFQSPKKYNALCLLGVSQVTKFINIDIKIFFDKLIY